MTPGRPRSAAPRSFRASLGGALLAGVIAAAHPAAAARLTDFTQEELRTLPSTCLAQRFINEELAAPVVPDAERERLSTKLGHSFIHYHHYCWALLWLARAEQPDGDKFNFHRAIDNLDYVIRNADPSFALMPQVYLLKGDILARTGKRDAALIEYRNALRADPTYTPAYLALAQHYVDAGDPAAARAVLAEGLRHDPRAQALTQKQAELGAKP
ncbi:MAG: tetratricopeptide repeat protein [Deltaproteobacteria bacterium]|nr:tetratricopeptide repeat protein [Deltaproteobacteria bacterium]